MELGEEERGILKDEEEIRVKAEMQEGEESKML